jgi:Zn-dependent protease
VLEIIENADASLPLILLLFALLGVRVKVRPQASVFIKAPAADVFAALDLRDGDAQRWHRSDVSVSLVDAATRTYRMRFVTTLSSGVKQASQALFRVVEREVPRRLVLERTGIDGRSTANELLRIEAGVTPGEGGSVLNLTYFWGPRPLTAQLLARADLWGSAYRLKGFIETGRPDLVTDNLISAGVALATGLVTLAAFTWWFGWFAAAILVAALFVHELGHLIAFRLIGQPWGRMVFLPFLGALAVPRLPFHAQAESVFAALMGPGFSLVIPAAAALAAVFEAHLEPLLIKAAIVTAVLNLFNLLPVEPLDGGVALRSMMTKLFGQSSHYALAAIGAVILLAGWQLREPLLLIFGGIAVAGNLRPRAIDRGLVPLSFLQWSIALFGFVAIAAAYLTALTFLMGQAGL